MKILAAFLILLLLILQYKFWFEEGGYLYNYQLQKELDALKAENEKLRQRNLDLARQIILVKEDMHEIEALARKNLGMVKEGERYFFIVDDKDTQDSNEPKHMESPQ